MRRPSRAWAMMTLSLTRSVIGCVVGLGGSLIVLGVVHAGAPEGISVEPGEGD